MKSLEELRAAELRNHGADFVGWAQGLLRIKNNVDQYLASPAARRSPERVQRLLLQRSAVPGSTLDGDQGALADVGIASAGFVASLVGLSIFDTALTAMRRLPWDAPGARIMSRVIGHSPAENAYKPISRLEVAPETLARHKTSAIVVVSDTLADSTSGAAAAAIAAELRRAVVEATDGPFLAALADGITPASTSGSPPDILADLEVLLAGIESDANSRLFLAVPAGVMKRLVTAQTTTGALLFPTLTVNGGTVQGLTIMPSDHLPTTGSPAETVSVLFDARQIAASDNGVRLDQARHSSLQLDDDPTAGAQNMVSLWQANARALRAERAFAFARLRESAVATATVNW